MPDGPRTCCRWSNAPSTGLTGCAAAPRIKIGADVLLWWSAKGVYFMIERGGVSVADLLDVPGVGGAWWGGAEPLEPPFTTRDNSGLQVSYLFLDDEPAEVAERLRPRLESAGLPPVPSRFSPLPSTAWWPTSGTATCPDLRRRRRSPHRTVEERSRRLPEGR